MGEINELVGEHPTLDHEAGPVRWDDPDLARLLRVRFVADSWGGPWDLSYAHGELRDGRCVRVQMPMEAYQIHATGGQIKGELITLARRDNVFLKGLCGGDIDSVLSMCW